MTFRLVTAVDRINYFLDNYISYYKRFFIPDEFYFLVHYKNYDEITQYLLNRGFSHFEKYTEISFGEGHNVVNQNRLQKKFIDEGYTVIYADVDERIFHPNLREYITNSTNDIIIPTGMMIVQRPSDPPLDKTKNVLEQERGCRTDIRWYSKVCILKKPFEWHHGRHNKPDRHIIDSDIYLIDLGRVCVDFAIENNIKSKNIYHKVLWRYAEMKKQLIEQEFFNPVRHDLKEIPTHIKSSNLF